MTGLARLTRVDLSTVGTKALVAKVCDFAVFSSVNGHAQAAGVIRAETLPKAELAGEGRRPAPKP